jgi:hypothetical protein
MVGGQLHKPGTSEAHRASRQGLNNDPTGRQRPLTHHVMNINKRMNVRRAAYRQAALTLDSFLNLADPIFEEDPEAQELFDKTIGEIADRLYQISQDTPR